MAGMTEASPQALEIVATELTATLNQARVALEASAERPGDPAPLATVADLLRQARGVLRVVEIFGAALLAEEMELASRFLMKSGDSRQRAEGLDALMRALVQLPAYLERVLGGGRDLPLVVLPLLNDLRAVRGASLLSEGTLLSLNLTSEREPEPQPAAPGEPALTVPQWARRLRPRFQLALLGLLRGADPAEHLAVLSQAASRLEAVATTRPVFQLWWVVGAVIEAMKSGALSDGASVKRLLGQADRELKRLYELGEQLYSERPPLELMNNLLYYVSRAGGQSPRVAAVRSSFRLGELLPVDDSIEEERESLSAPSVKLMHTVAGAIKEDLDRVKDALDLFSRKGGQPEELAPQVELLKKIGDTLAVLGLGSLREQVQAELGRLNDVVARRVTPEPDTLIGIAAALINVEDSLDDSLVRMIMPPGAPVPGVIDDPEFRQVAGAVLRECAVNLARIKELVLQSLQPEASTAGIDAVPGLARGITSGLLMLGKSRAVEITERVVGQITSLMQPNGPPVAPEIVDRLADAVVSVEYYMDTLQAGRGDPWYMLDNAERCLAAIESAAPPPLAGLPAASVPEATPEAYEPTVVLHREPVPAEPTQVMRGPVPAEPTQVMRGPMAPPPAAQAEPELPDTELLGVFVEEAREEVEVITQVFPLWQETPADRDSLVRMRRAFHTLKGSGRMVGATVLGEFAWSVENLLNRLIDGTRERTGTTMSVLGDAVAALPGLIDAFERGIPAVDGIDAIAARARELAEGPAAAPRVTPPAAAAAPAPVQPATDETAFHRALVEPPAAGLATPGDDESAALAPPAGTPPEPVGSGEATGAPAPAATEEPAHAPEARPVAPQAEEEPAQAIDYSLQDIYRKEMQTHLEVMRSYLRSAWTTPAPHHVSEELYRACHTLRGASRTAQVRHCVQLAEPLHRWLRRMFDHDRPFDEDSLSTLADSVELFEDILDHINEDTGYFRKFDHVVGQISALDLALEQAIAAEPPPSAEPEEPPEPEVVEEPPEEEPEPPEPERFRIDHLIPPVVVATPTLPPGEGFDRLLPPEPGEPAVQDAVPYGAVPRPGAPEAQPPPVAPPAVQPPAAAESQADADYDPDIAAIFCEEATELLEGADSALGALRAERGSRERVVELQRALHTIKGGARMAGIGAMGDLSHELESLLIQVGAGSAPLEERTFEVVQATLDELSRMRDFVNAGRRVAPARDLITRIQLVARGATPQPVVEPPAPPPAAGPAAVEMEEPYVNIDEEPPVAAEPEEPAPAAAPEPARAATGPTLPGREAPAERAEMARVDSELLDEMLNNAGEVSIFRSRLEQQLSSVEFNITELGRVVQRLKEQLRKLEIETEAQILHRHVEHSPRRDDFDPLELDRYSTIQQYSRALAETASDVGSVQALLGSLTREAQNLLTQQGRVISDVQNGLMRTRMVPFQRHVQRLTRIVRQAATEAGKKAELSVTGASGELDRQVLERMLPPFEHLLRNAVVHGIESPAERLAHGKPETGRIELKLRREGSEVVIAVTDDGGGINLRAVREKAAVLGIVEPKQELSDEQALQLILEPGFSTATRLTQSAGRGVGMDVVATEIKKLGGALFIESEEGRGTTFTIRLPFTLAISQALVVRVGDEFFALPLPTVEGVVRVPAAEVQRQLAEDAAGFEYGGQKYRFQHLGTFVGGSPTPPSEHDPAVPVILVRAGEHSTGIVADELVGSREIVVKSVGPQIAGIRGVSGATILGDGRICVILDVGALVRSEWRARVPLDAQAGGRADRRVFALVVDDSITVRRVTQRLLERNGMRVMTAKDGLDAIGVLQDHVPDVILLDIEMPRMDGYEVASHVRNDSRLKDIPIVMITSRVGEKHRARAIELGVDEYLGKPYQETQLLQALEPLVQRRRAS